MKILYISSLIFKKSSSASIRNVGLINGLIQKGQEVDVLTIDYGKEGNDPFLIKELSSEVNVLKTEIPILKSYSKVKKKESFISKILSKFNWFKEIYKTLFYFPDVDKDWIKLVETEKLGDNYDIIISSSDSKTSHFVAQEVMKKSPKEMKWIQIWGDPWEEDVNLNYIERKRVAKHEHKLLQLADYIFYVSMPTTKMMKSKYPQIEQKIYYLGRSYLKEVYGRELGVKDKWEVLYTGSLNNTRNIQDFLEEINNYNRVAAKKIILKMFGNISEKNNKIIANYDFVEIKGVVEFSRILEEYANCDILLFIDNGGESTQIPGKLFDYLGTDRPIISLVESLSTPVSLFIQSLKSTIVIENIPEKIEFPNLSLIDEKKINSEFSGECLARKLLDIIS